MMILEQWPSVVNDYMYLIGQEFPHLKVLLPQKRDILYTYRKSYRISLQKCFIIHRFLCVDFLTVMIVWIIVNANKYLEKPVSS